MGVSPLDGRIGNDVGHNHPALEVDCILARRNAYDLEFSSFAVVMDVAGGSVAGNEIELAAMVAHDAVAHWHDEIMLRPESSWYSVTIGTLSPGRSWQIWTQCLNSSETNAQTRKIS